MWREDFDALGLEPLGDGAQVVVAPAAATSTPARAPRRRRSRSRSRRCAWPARATCSPSSSGCAARSHAEGLFEPQKRLPRPSLPRCIGVVTGEGGKARDDVLAGLRRRGWAGRLVWAFAPVQDRHAAPAITRALQDLAACEEVEVIVVARGGGSLADLFAFCDETLCRTVALLRVPVISSVGHHTDRTLIDDVAAVACSTPTHAAEAAVPVDCAAARARAARRSPRGSSARAGARSSSAPARSPGSRARPPTTSRATARGCTSTLRELRASARRGLAARAPARHAARPRSSGVGRRALGLARGATRARADAAALDRAAPSRSRAARDLERLAARARRARPAAHARARLRARRGPERGEPVTSAAAAREHAALTLRLARRHACPSAPTSRRARA